MFFKNKKFKKQMSSLLFAGVMAVATITGAGISALNGSNGPKEVNAATTDLKISSFTVSKPSGVGIADQITLKAKATGGSGNYEYRFGTIYNGKTYYSSDTSYNNGYSSSNSITTTGYGLIYNSSGTNYVVNSGNNTLFVQVRDKSTGKSVRITKKNYNIKGLTINSLNVTSDYNSFFVGERISLSVDVENEAGYRYNPRLFSYSTDNGKTYTVINSYGGGYYGCSFVPTKAGKYLIKYSISDFIGQKAEKIVTINVKDASKKVVVYYNNSNWSNANIHYGINGNWTNVPGVAMKSSDNPKYTWKYVIDLGDASSVQVCFNDGNGNWDSRYGANYTLTAGSYCIVYGNIYNA